MAKHSSIVTLTPNYIYKVGVPEWRVEAVTGELLGRPPCSIDDFVSDYAELFK